MINRFSFNRVFLLSCFSFISSVSYSAQPPTFTIEKITKNGYYPVRIFAINNAGDMVGESPITGNTQQATLWRHDGSGAGENIPGINYYTTTGTHYVGADNTAVDINNQGWMIGSSSSDNANYFYDTKSNGNAQLAFEYRAFYKINDAGRVIGHDMRYLSTYPNKVLDTTYVSLFSSHSSGRAMTSIRSSSLSVTPGGAGFTVATPYDLNENNDFVINATEAYIGHWDVDSHSAPPLETINLRTTEPFTSLFTNVTKSEVYAINDSGEHIGTQIEYSSGSYVGWLRDLNGNITVIPSISGSDYGAYPIEINNSGTVVGGNGGNAFIWNKEYGTKKLSDLVENFENSGWSRLFVATNLSENGYVVGMGVHNDSIHAFRLSMVEPEPVSFELVINDADESAGPELPWIPMDDEVILFFPGPGSEWTEDASATAYNEDYHYLSSESGESKFNWQFTVPETGLYYIDAYWPVIAESGVIVGSATYTISDESATYSSDVQQDTNGNQWNNLGQFNFNAGTVYSVILSASAGETAIADAIKIHRIVN